MRGGAGRLDPRAPLFALVAALLPLDALGAGASAPPPSPGPACAATFAVPADRLARLSRGYNLTGWIDVREEREPEPDLLRRLRDAGFRHVRLPVPAEDLMPRFADPARTAERLALVARILDTMLALDTAVVVDLHGGEGVARLYAADPDAAADAVETAWDALVPLLRARPAAMVFAELLNEPPVPADRWDDDARRLVAHLRAALPDTTLVVGPAGPQRVEPLAERPPIDDPNLVYAVHFYDPMAFTHQGASWMGDDPLAVLADVPFPADRATPRLKEAVAGMDAIGRPDAADLLARVYAEPWNADRIAEVFRRVSDWSARSGHPVVVGEFGVLRFAAAPADRAAWIGAVRTAAEAGCIGWTHWEFRDGFGFIDPATGEPEPDILRALGLTPP